MEVILRIPNIVNLKVCFSHQNVEFVAQPIHRQDPISGDLIVFKRVNCLQVLGEFVKHEDLVAVPQHNLVGTIGWGEFVDYID